MEVSSIPSDIEIAQAARMLPIQEIAAQLGLGADDLDTYGKYKAKIPLEIAQRPIKGRLVLVTAVNPTPAGEGKSTVTVGLTQALRKLGTNAVLCMREPSLGPVFGMKGGAAGGGYAQLLPMQDINLHFTGDFHAISSAHALLSALLDNHMQWGNALNVDPRRISWHRAIDMNDRALREIVVGLGGTKNGVAREEKFVIVPASEIMAIVALAQELPGPRGPAGAHHRGGHARVARGARCARASSRRRARWRCCSPTPSGPTSCRRSRAAPPSCTPARSATSRTAATRMLATRVRAGAGRPRDHRGGLRIRPRRREVLRHQVPHGRVEPRGGGARRDRPLAEDAGRRQQEGADDRGPRRARARPAEPREAHRERAAVRRARRRRDQSRRGRHRARAETRDGLRREARRSRCAHRGLVDAADPVARTSRRSSSRS